MNFDIEKYKGKYVMHCKTEEEAEIFCRHLDCIGRLWNSGETYALNTNWYHYREATCYNFNEGTFCCETFYRTHGYTILEMEDFIEENKDLNYVDSIFKMLGLKPEQPFMIRGNENLYKLSSQLRVYRYFNKTSLSYKEGWHDAYFNLQDILVGNIKIKKIKTE